MTKAQTTGLVADERLAVRISLAAYELIQRSGDRRTAGVSAVVPLRGTSVEITLAVARAAELDAWAQDVWENVDRGQRKTLSFFRNAMAAAMREHRIRDCIPDPGKAAILEARNGGARLSMGDVVVDMDNDNDLVQIVSGPDFYKVPDEQGIYVEKNGRRFNWRYGYRAALCREGGIVAGMHFFYAPYRLLSKDDGGITHLKLVYNGESRLS